MPTHYEVLGVSSAASDDVLRRAYRERARRLHPDRLGDASPAAAERAAREMQAVNEAWRVLRDASSRADYDRRLAGPAPPGRPVDVQAPPAGWDSYDARADDLGARVVRGLPWLLAGVVLAVIFVFTAFAAGGGDDEPTGHDLVGRCVQTSAGDVRSVPCEDPNEGRVVLVVTRSSHCPNGLTATPVGPNWLCLRRVTS